MDTVNSGERPLRPLSNAAAAVARRLRQIATAIERGEDPSCLATAIGAMLLGEVELRRQRELAGSTIDVDELNYQGW